jgi:PAS domain S-box-containing protein
VQAVPVAHMPSGHMVHCWEQKQCGETECVHYGKLGYLCWTSSNRCCTSVELSPEDRIIECFKCPVYQANVNYISEVQEHFERYVSEAEQAFAKLRAERDSLGRELSKVRALLTASVDQSAEYIFACDPFGRLMLWNPALVALTGQSLSATSDISAAVRLLQPAGGAEAWTFMEFLEGRHPEGLYETSLPDRQDQERVISWGCLKVKDSAGQPLGLLATGRDITEYRRAELALREIEERQRYVTENISEGLALLIDGRLTYANQALASLLGYELNELEAMEFTELFAPSRRDSARDFSRRSEEDGVLRYQSVALSRDGSEIHVEVTQGPAQFHDQRAQIIMLRDASARRRMLAYERLIPICSGCGAIRDDSTSAPGQGSWHSLGDFIENTVESALTHTLCPHCAAALHDEAVKLGNGDAHRRIS